MKMSYKGCLVTGGAGFIGSNLIRRLYYGHTCSEVYVIDNLYSGSLDNIINLLEEESIKFYNIDLSCNKHLNKVFPRDTDVVFHLAAVTGLEEVEKDPITAFKSNVIATMNILDTAVKYGVNTIIYASSAAVYGEPHNLPVSEGHKANPTNLYGYMKYLGEMLLNHYYIKYGLNTIILRYFNVYGPRMRGGPYASVIHNFITSLSKNLRPVIFGDGRQTRDFIYVDDVVEASIRSMELEGFNILNIGSGVETSILDLLNIISSILGYKDVNPIYKPRRRHEIYRIKADISKARAILNWSPKVSLKEGVRKTIDWYKNYVFK